MRKTSARAGRARILALMAVVMVLLAGCVTPLAATPHSATAAPSGPTPVVIYAPATPASVPILMAAQHMDAPPADVTIFTNHAQANSLFMRGDVDILVTGLSVGVDLFKNGAPIQVVNSYVAGLTYLVTYGSKVDSLAALKGKEIYIPFEGSPIEEALQFFAAGEGLTWKTDLKPVYSPFASSVELLKQGKATAVALPEPYVSLIEKEPNLFISLSFREKWDAMTGSTVGYPQVTSFVKRDWAASHPEAIARFNDELAAALQTIQQGPAAAAEQVQAQMNLPAPILLASLRRTDLALTTSDAMAHSIQGYYRTIGKPLDETFDAFFYNSPQ